MLFAAILPLHHSIPLYVYRISIGWHQIPSNVQSHDVIWALKLQETLPKNWHYICKSVRQTDRWKPPSTSKLSLKYLNTYTNYYSLIDCGFNELKKLFFSLHFYIRIEYICHMSKHIILIDCGFNELKNCFFLCINWIHLPYVQTHRVKRPVFFFSEVVKLNNNHTEFICTLFPSQHFQCTLQNATKILSIATYHQKFTPTQLCEKLHKLNNH